MAYNIDREVSTRRISPRKFWCFSVLVFFFLSIRLLEMIAYVR